MRILSALETLWETPIEEYCANDAGYRQMLRLMSINASMRETISNNLGNGTISDVNKVSDEVEEYQYSYTDDVNYLKNYQKEAEQEETYGGNVTNWLQNYGKGGKLYGWAVNEYPDDNGTGADNFTEDVKQKSTNKNSILKKTKDLFNERKIRTIISRFYTDNMVGEFNDQTQSATSVYGLSHGRNLLTYEAERKGNAYDTNGYKNPYCRVWTHHHQYSELRSRLIRPFVENTGENVNKWDDFHDQYDENSSRVDMIGTGSNKTIADRVLKDFNFSELQRRIYKDGKDYKVEKGQGTKWSWRDSGTDGYKLSVLNNKTGFLNIAPKFLGGAEKNIHPKDCMFSIENLAWQGYDPYSFEKALSWEQRGPFGGRIMWFPPYGIQFSEDTSVNWNEQSFIGRGENVFTYTNTARSGTLSFMMVVDHPSIVDYATWHDPKDLKDTDILRFFAGCQGTDAKAWLKSFAEPTPLTDEYLEKDNTDSNEPVTEIKAPTPPEVPSDEEIEVDFYVFYPNNYSGYYDRKSDSKVDPIAYLLIGNGAQWKCNTSDVTRSQVLPLSYNNKKQIDCADGSLGKGYEMANSGTDIRSQNEKNNFIIGTGYPKGYSDKRYIVNDNKRWYYRIDGEYVKGIKYNSIQNCFGQTFKNEINYQDQRTQHLNCDVDAVKKAFNEENDNLYSLAEVAYALCNDWENDAETDMQKRISENCGGLSKTNDRIKKLIELFDTTKGDESIYSITKIEVVGYSNSHGQNTSNNTNAQRNEFLAQERANTALNWVRTAYGKADLGIGSMTSVSQPSQSIDEDGNEDIKSVNTLTAKKWRSARVEIKIKKSGVVDTQKMEQYKTDLASYSRFSGFKEDGKDSDGNQLYVNTNEKDPSKKNRKWYYDEESKQMVLKERKYQVSNRFSVNSKTGKMESNGKDKNSLRYDQEYYFFKQLEAKSPDVFQKLTDKLQYFDPAFHSMTPEGFMGRLNFLHQCTRQGDTIGISDKNGASANNLAFGRPPFCILRLGDFYYQKIVIRNINITYDPLVWDLNQEGIGVVPLIANVSISFNFIGGGDLTGPVRKLQNAMSFNYYANGRLYDNRADRIEHEATNWETMGAMGNNKVDFNKSKFNHVSMAKH